LPSTPTQRGIKRTTPSGLCLLALKTSQDTPAIPRKNRLKAEEKNKSKKIKIKKRPPRRFAAPLK